MHSCIHFLEARSHTQATYRKKNSIILLHGNSYKIAQEFLQDHAQEFLQDTQRLSTELAERSFRGEKMGVGHCKHYEEIGIVIKSLFTSNWTINPLSLSEFSSCVRELHT